MIQKIVDLHVHSKYSRACSKDLELPTIARVCEVRGIDILTTGDFTHPLWFKHIEEYLVEETPGVYQVKGIGSKTRFIIGTEIASIKKHGDTTRRIHLLVFAPSIDAARRFNQRLEAGGFNLKSDGRPIIGLTSKQLLEIMLEIDDRMVMIPAHAWTPWFGVFGSKGGYRNLDEAFEDLTPHIRAIETGLSSDPLMNWRCSWLDDITVISNSDAHSPAKLGREANVLQFDSNEDVFYDEIMRIIQSGDRKKFIETIEFYPEEGKYHYDGHRECGVVMTPEDSKKHHALCPVCKRQLTIGVMNRVDELADRTEEQARKKGAEKIPYRSLVPLSEILADVYGAGPQTKKVLAVYDTLIRAFDNEFCILRSAALTDIAKVADKTVADAIARVRSGDIYIEPGYDGVFGVVKVFKDRRINGRSTQLGLELE